MTVRDIRLALVPPGTFSIPAGYQKTTLGARMGAPGGKPGAQGSEGEEGQVPNLEEIMKNLGQGEVE